jgi:hypothetical protein
MATRAAGQKTVDHLQPVDIIVSPSPPSMTIARVIAGLWHECSTPTWYRRRC